MDLYYVIYPSPFNSIKIWYRGLTGRVLDCRSGQCEFKSCRYCKKGSEYCWQTNSSC